MARSLLLIVLFALSVPSSVAKAHNKKQYIPCNDLWTAVTKTLGDASNYEMVAADDERMMANFVVVGARFRAMNLVWLKQRKSGCDLQVRVGFTGYNDEEWALRMRINRALKKLNAGQASPNPKSGPAQ